MLTSARAKNRTAPVPRGEGDGFTRVTHQRNRNKQLPGRPGLLEKAVVKSSNIFEVLNADVPPANSVGIPETQLENRPVSVEQGENKEPNSPRQKNSEESKTDSDDDSSGEMSEDCSSEDEKLEPEATGINIGNAADSSNAPAEPDNKNREDGDEDENMEESDDESQSEQLEKGEIELGVDDHLSPEQRIPDGAPSSKLSDTGAVAHRFNAKTCASWKENRDKILSWINSAEFPNSQLSQNNPSLWDVHAQEDSELAINQNQTGNSWNNSPSAIEENGTNSLQSNLEPEEQTQVSFVKDDSLFSEPFATQLSSSQSMINSTFLLSPELPNQVSYRSLLDSLNRLDIPASEEENDNRSHPRANPLPLPWIQPSAPNLSVVSNQSFIQTSVPPPDRLFPRAEIVMEPPSDYVVPTAGLPESFITSRVNDDPPRGQNRILDGSMASSTA
ncbi:hypothetical protein R1flu_003250 [Riccia fluitans]|uniref:Uncharacterized protein n=1 Tax=Riccia fluitans TaxID=41844 RepID=A0ABD1Y8Z9_9MARC